MPILPFITKLFSTGASDLIGTIGTVVDNLTTSKEEKEQLKIALIEQVNAHTQRMAELAQAETDSYLKDVDSARQMQIAALKQEDKFSKRFIYYLTIGVITLTFGFDISLFWVQYPERNHDLINMVCGIINTAGFASIMSFFYGSSKSSHNKQETLDAMAKTA